MRPSDIGNWNFLLLLSVSVLALLNSDASRDIIHFLRTNKKRLFQKDGRREHFSSILVFNQGFSCHQRLWMKSLIRSCRGMVWVFWCLCYGCLMGHGFSALVATVTSFVSIFMVWTFTTRSLCWLFMKPTYSSPLFISFQSLMWFLAAEFGGFVDK